MALLKKYNIGCFVVGLILSRFDVFPVVKMNSLFFPENGGPKFLQIVGEYITDYKESYHKREYCAFVNVCIKLSFPRNAWKHLTKLRDCHVLR
jgi:hypothetical protein